MTKLRILWLLSFLLFGTGAWAQHLTAVCKNNLWGFINNKGEVKIPFQYTNVSFLGDSYISVKQNGKWQVINNNGQPCSKLYDSIEIASPKAKLLWVKAGNKQGLLKNNGQELLAPVYDSVASYFYRNIDYIPVRKDSLWGYANPKGEIVINFKYTACEFFDQGLAYVQTNAGAGFVNKRGVEIIPLKYSYASYFSEGCCVASIPYRNDIYINKKNKQVIADTFIIASNFSEGLANVYNNNVNGYINKKGKMVIPLKGYGGEFENGYATVSPDNGWGLIDKKGKYIVPAVYEEPLTPFTKSVGLVDVCQNGQYGYYNLKGQEVIAPQYDEVNHWAIMPFILVSQNSRYGLIAYSGQVVVPIEYDSIMSIDKKGDPIGAIKNGKAGFISAKGTTLVPFIYDSVGSFYDGYAPVLLNDKWSYIDSKGKPLGAMQFDRVTYYSPNNLNPVMINGLWGFIDKKGTLVIPAIYQDYKLNIKGPTEVAPFLCPSLIEEVLTPVTIDDPRSYEDVHISMPPTTNDE